MPAHARLPVLLLAAVLLCPGGSAQPVLIDFDGQSQPCVFSSTTRLDTLYAAQGITFEGPTALDGGAILDQCGGFSVSGHSAPNFLAFNAGSGLSSGGIPRGPETMLFSPPVQSVGLLAGHGSGGPVTLECFDGGGLSLGTDSLTATSTLQPLLVSAPGIERCVVTFSATVMVLDDITFDPTALPTCAMTVPIGTVSGDVPVDVDAQSTSSTTVTLVLEYYDTLLGSWSTCTMAPGSPATNPTGAVPLGVTSFLWDSHGDGVATAGVTTVDLRVTVDDGVGVDTCVSSVDLDNSALCWGICGDCDENAAGPTVLDALVAAQISAGLTTPTPTQVGCCDPNGDGAITILDALTMAQAAAGLTVTLICP